jgi:hypothetical protein
MSITTDFGTDAGLRLPSREVGNDLPYTIDETYWGYIIRANQAPPSGLLLGQAMAWFAGIAFIVAAIGLWVLPLSSTNPDVVPLKLGVSILFFGFAAMLMWFASRGTEAELQIDTALGEVREVMRNRAGKPSLIGRYGFDAIGGVYIDRQATVRGLPMGHGCLMLRYRNTAQTLPVVAGAESQLMKLRDRLGRDLMVKSRTAAPVA